MRHVWITSIFALTAFISSQAQAAAPPPPQTARQALIEMFMGKNADSFEKHLPEIARRALIRKGETLETSLVQKISMIGRQLSAQGEHVETFDVGVALLISEQEVGKERIEVIVEHDSLTGEQDEIELSIHAYRNGEPKFLPVIPRLIFSMIQEKDVWRLSEVTVAAHIPLTDADYLNGFRKKADAANERIASDRIAQIVSAEMSYNSAHPERGYACHLADLSGKSDASDSAPPSEGVRPDLSAEEFAGYRFSISNCNGNPSSKFQVTAVPVESDSSKKAFCGNESGTVRFDLGGSGAACLRRGTVINEFAPAPKTD